MSNQEQTILKACKGFYPLYIVEFWAPPVKAMLFQILCVPTEDSIVVITRNTLQAVIFIKCFISFFHSILILFHILVQKISSRLEMTRTSTIGR